MRLVPLLLWSNIMGTFQQCGTGSASSSLQHKSTFHSLICAFAQLFVHSDINHTWQKLENITCTVLKMFSFFKYLIVLYLHFFLSQILHVLYLLFLSSNIICTVVYNFFFKYYITFFLLSPVKITGPVLCVLYSEVRRKNNNNKTTPHKRQELCHTK